MEKKEAIKILKDFHDKSALFSVRTALETLHPELKESEDERIRKEIIAWLKNSEGQTLPIDRYNAALAWLEKQGKKNPAFEMKTPEESLGIDSDTYNKIVDECIYDEQKSQRMISAEAKEAMYDKPADKVEPKCDESKTKIFDAPTPFEDKLYAFVLACEILVDPSKREFILEHSQEILDAAREQIGKEQSSAWSKEDERLLNNMIIVIKDYYNDKDAQSLISWLKSLRPQNKWKPSDEQMADLWNMLCECRPADHQLLQDIYYGLKKLREE